MEWAQSGPILHEICMGPVESGLDARKIDVSQRLEQNKNADLVKIFLISKLEGGISRRVGVLSIWHLWGGYRGVVVVTCEVHSRIGATLLFFC